MCIENLSKYSFDNFIIGRIHREDTEIPLQSQINSERPGLLIQTREEEQILNVLPFLQLFPIENRAIIHNLPQQLNRLLSPVLIHVRHVQIIDKANQSLASCRPKGLATLLLNHTLDVLL